MTSSTHCIHAKWLVLCYIALSSLHAFAKDAPKVVTAVAAFSPDLGGNLRAEVDLGELESGTAVELKIAILNSSGNEIKIASAKSSCNCVAAELESNVLKRDQATVLNAKINTPKSVSSPQQVIQVDLKREEGGVLPVILKYRIAGLLCFRERFGVVDISTESAAPTKCRLPILFTNPVDVHDIEVKVVAKSEVAGKIVEVDGIYFAEFSFGAKDLESISGVGEVRIKDRRRGFSDEVPFVVRSVDQVAVMPSTIRFVTSADGPVATALVRVLKESGEKEPLDRSSVIKCYFSGKRITVKSRPLGRGIYRIQLPQPSRQENEDDKPVSSDLIWSVTSGAKEHVVVTPTQFVPEFGSK